MNETQLDRLRARLPALAAEMDYAIEQAMTRLGQAIRLADAMGGGDMQRAWGKGLRDARLILRPVSEAQQRFQAWLVEAACQIGADGVSEEEKASLLAGFRAGGAEAECARAPTG